MIRSLQLDDPSQRLTGTNNKVRTLLARNERYK